MRDLFDERIKRLFEERMRCLCAKAIAATNEPELQSALAELRAALHEHAQFLEYVTVRATRDAAEKAISLDAA